MNLLKPSKKQHAEERILDLVKYNIINFLLQLNIKIGRKLSYLLAKYEADEYAVNNEKIDLRSIPKRIKNVLLHDQDIIDKRWAECEKCEFLKTKEKMGKEYSRCQKCGCFMKIGDTFVKIKVATSSCPLNPPKWDKEYEFIKGKPTNGTQPIAK